MSLFRVRLFRVSVLLLGALALPALAPAQLRSLPAFPFRSDGPVLRAHVAAHEPFTVAGPRGILVGQQQGTLEAWLLPVKILSHLTVQAQVEGYPVPLDLNSMAREIEVRPDRTTITYAHITLTLRQTMFAPEDAPAGTGAVILFEIDSVRPVTLTISFTPELREMWPKPSSGNPSAEWVTEGQSGLYVLHSDFNNLAAAVALPGATSGVMAPYQERPQFHPLELILHTDPAHDRTRVFPLLLAVGRTPETATTQSLANTLATLDQQLPALYAAHAARIVQQEGRLTQIVTPDAALNQALSWAETSIGQLQARTAPTPDQPLGELGLVAGYYASGDSARPGFGWYFGRDTLYTIYAIDSYGDFPLARLALEFLLRRQRADGKIMHEFSQTAADVDWAGLPYEYAAADATPLMLTALTDYVRSSGDLAFLRAHREQVLKAWQFETTHDADGDGIYDNAQGTGWVESWPPGMPRQEIYLALLDEQASRAMSELATLLELPDVSSQASRRAETVHQTIEHEYYLPETRSYAFSRNEGGVLDHTRTIYPAIAWWNGGAGLDKPEVSLKQWSSHDFATDWGLRDIGESDPLYDPISYHQGSVWPLFTGWQSLAEYRSGHPLAGYQTAMQNAELTTAQDLGAVTELLSGAFFEPFGRSTSHQLWSSAMVVTPLLRGLFGIAADALNHYVVVTPHLPADWPTARVERLHVGDAVINLDYKRLDGTMQVTIEQVSGPLVHFPANAATQVQRTPLPAVEVAIPHGLPLPGARTAQLKVLGEAYTDRSLTLELEAQAGSEILLPMRVNRPSLHPRAENASVVAGGLKVHFAEGAGYVSRTVTIHW